MDLFPRGMEVNRNANRMFKYQRNERGKQACAISAECSSSSLSKVTGLYASEDNRSNRGSILELRRLSVSWLWVRTEGIARYRMSQMPHQTLAEVQNVLQPCSHIAETTPAGLSRPRLFVLCTHRFDCQSARTPRKPTSRYIQ